MKKGTKYLFITNNIFMEKQAALELIDFINESPTNFHAILNIKKELIAHGFIQLLSGESWQIEEEKNISL